MEASAALLMEFGLRVRLACCQGDLNRRFEMARNVNCYGASLQLKDRWVSS